MLIETLESRWLLSSVLTGKGTLVVSGGGAADTIVVRRDLKRASKIIAIINGAGQKYDSISVKRIFIEGLGSGDNLQLDDSLGIISARGATLVGGDGNDTLTGGLASATFDGGNGDDSITATSADDSIDAGAGNDTVVGGGGTDFVVGGSGADLIAGGKGDDYLYGDAGNDTIYGGDGNDTIGGDGEDRIAFSNQAAPAATPGNDLLSGGNGNDWVTGGDESQTLHDQNNGKDTLIGGAGNDILDARGWDVNTTNPFDVIQDRQGGDIVPMEDHTRQATQQEINLGEAAYVVHDHARIYIKIDDGSGLKDAVLDGGIGDFADPNLDNTGPNFHIHSGDPNELHMHDLEAHTYTLGEFFRIWGVTFSTTHIGRYVVGNGKTLTVVVKHGDNGTPQTIADPYNYVIQGAPDVGNGDQITITYA